MTRIDYAHIHKEHLSVLLTNFFGPARQSLMVNFTTLYPRMENPDKTHVVEAGVHPKITHESFVVYSRAEIIKEDDLKRREQSGLLRLVEPLDQDMIQAILDGVRISKRTKQYVLDFLDEHGL